jgi:hypothetical protein
MGRYATTEKAGPFAAAHRNTGVGTILRLSDRQAEHELRLGTLTALAKPELGSGHPAPGAAPRRGGARLRRQFKQDRSSEPQLLPSHQGRVVNSSYVSQSVDRVARHRVA